MMSDSLPPHCTAEDWFNQALEHLDRSDYPAVLACCDQAIVLDPNHGDAWWVKGQVLQKLEQYELALESFDRVVALEPESYQIWELHSYALINLDRVEAALASMDRAIALMPAADQNWLLYYYRGRWLCDLGQTPEGIASFEQAAAIVLNSNPPPSEDLNDLWSALGYHYTMTGQYEQAIAAYENAPSVSIEATDEIWLYALLQLGRQDEIFARYNHLVEAEPDSDAAWKRRGLAMAQLGRLEEAIDSYQRALVLNPDSSVWYRLQQALEQLGQPAEILNYYQEILAIYPDHAATWAGQAFSLRKLERNEAALASYEQAFSLGLRHEDYPHYSWFDYATLLKEFGRPEAAMTAYRQAATLASIVEPLGSATIDYWCYLGNLFYEMERYEEAIECYENTPFLQYDAELNYIATLTALGRLDDFVTRFDPPTGSSLDPELMWLKRGRVLEQLGELEAAIESYNQLLQINPDNTTALSACSEILFDLERDEEAIAMFDRLIQLKPDYPEPYYGKARCYAYIQQYDAALASLQTAIELDEMRLSLVIEEDNAEQSRESRYREIAKVDEAFTELYEDERFQQLMNE